MQLSTVAETVRVGQAITVTMTLVNGKDSQARLGLLEYRLGASPNTAFDPGNLEPVQLYTSLAPGESRAAEFVLQAMAPGTVQLTGSVGFELHAIPEGWGSWSECDSTPMEIVITP